MTVTAANIQTRLTAAPLGLPLGPNTLDPIHAERYRIVQAEDLAIVHAEGWAQHAIVTASKFHLILTAISSWETA